MTKVIKNSITAVLLISTQGAFAAGPYAGATLGTIAIDGADKNPINIGIIGGYDINRNGFTIGGEVELIISLADGEAGFGSDFSVSNQGVYATGKYDFNERVYGKARLGLSRTNVDLDGFDDNTETGLAGGIGGGYKMNQRVAIEANFTVITDDANLFTIGANYKFN